MVSISVETLDATGLYLERVSHPTLVKAEIDVYCVAFFCGHVRAESSTHSSDAN